MYAVLVYICYQMYVNNLSLYHGDFNQKVAVLALLPCQNADPKVDKGVNPKEHNIKHQKTTSVLRKKIEKSTTLHPSNWSWSPKSMDVQKESAFLEFSVCFSGIQQKAAEAKVIGLHG